MASTYIRYPTPHTGDGTITNINTAVGPSVSLLAGTGINVNTVGNNITVSDTSNAGAGPSKVLYVDQNQPGTYTPDGSILRPFTTIGAAVTQIITNADNITFRYQVLISAGSYAETITLNSTTLYNVSFMSRSAVSGAGGDSSEIVTLTGNIVSTASNDNLKNIEFNGLSLSTAITLTGASNGTTFGLQGITFANCTIYLTGGGIAITNAGDILFQLSEIRTTSGSGNIAFNNVNFFEFNYSGVSSGTLSLVTNNAGNKPSGFAGTFGIVNYAGLVNNTTIDAGSELDYRFARIGSSSSKTVTNNGIIKSFQSVWNSTATLNTGSTLTSTGDVIVTPFIISGGGVTYPGILHGLSINTTNSLLNGSISGTITQQAADTTISYSVKWPNAQGAASTTLTNDGSGNLSWAASGGAGATTALDNLASTAVNAAIVPNASNTFNLGSASKPWQTVFTALTESPDNHMQQIEMIDFISLINTIQIRGDALSTPAGNQGAGIVNNDAAGILNTAIFSTNTSGNSGQLFLETGNSSGGNSGHINLQTGTAVGTRGNIVLSGNNIFFAPDTSIDAGGVVITDLADPIGQTDASTKQYSDGDFYNTRAFSSTTTISSTLATIVYATVDYDGGSVYDNTTGVYTVPRAGFYHVKASLLIAATISLNNNIIMEIQKNGTVVSRRTKFLPAALTDGDIAIDDTINCAALDTLQIKVSTTGAAPSIVSSNFDNYFTVTKS